ncbi:MAG: HTH-type transcriptional repressor PurR [Lentisphaerae bacterium ADurb.Bin242]|nr:MAG: HTH-type transcriptional repressor PurR [Lentisphaerae bacterium ADurb.Bin242]
MATLKDVSKKAGVGLSTVSYVINKTGLHKVSPATQERIHRAARELGYTPNVAGRILNGGRSGMIGVIMPMRMPLIYSNVPADICALLRSKNYQVAVGVASSFPECLNVMNDMASRKVEGMIFFNCEEKLDDYYHKTQIPILHFDGMTGEIRMALEEGQLLAMRHLIEVHGHRKIGCFSSLRRFNLAKVAGYRKALKEAGLKHSEDWEIDAFENPDWIRETLAKIRRHQLTAMICNNDDYATKLICILMQNGIRVPDDCAVIGYDGDCYGPYLSVPLTTVVQPVSLLVQRMADAILKKIQDHILVKMEPEVLSPYLHIERSCGCQAHSEIQLQTFSSYSLDITDKKG